MVDLAAAVQTVCTFEECSYVQCRHTGTRPTANLTGCTPSCRNQRCEKSPGNAARTPEASRQACGNYRMGVKKNHFHF